MVMDKSLYSHLAGLLEYPKEDMKIRVEECVKSLASDQSYPAVAVEELKKFQKDLEELPLDDLQGVYSYTFELTSDFTLDMGYHLYDGFKRANKLATIKSMYREQGFPFEEIAKGELPDHLPIILYFLGSVKDEALKKDFRESFVIIAMEKLNKNFEKNKKNIYSHLISVIYRVLEKDVKEVK
ncbi:MAG: hypothetical protein HY954_02290 [Deltaproteobacteria bacterium]|nr:hypothetical protein [Deltaproteobacteria bacterium]